MHAQAEGSDPIVVASKPFGESYLLAEMFAQVLESHGIAVKRVRGLGSTEIVFAAVRAGSVDVYPDYTGTIAQVMLKSKGRPSLEEMRQALAPQGVGISGTDAWSRTAVAASTSNGAPNTPHARSTCCSCASRSR